MTNMDLFRASFMRVDDIATSSAHVDQNALHRPIAHFHFLIVPFESTGLQRMIRLLRSAQGV
jgi:hypothetical protein